MIVICQIDAFFAFGTWKVVSNECEEGVPIDKIICYCVVKIEGTQFPIQGICNFLELFDDLHAIITANTKTESKLSCEVLAFVK